MSGMLALRRLFDICICIGWRFSSSYGCASNRDAIEYPFDEDHHVVRFSFLDSILCSEKCASWIFFIAAATCGRASSHFLRTRPCHYQ